MVKRQGKKSPDKRREAQARRREKIMGPWQAGLEHEMKQASKDREKLNNRKKGVAKLSVASNSCLLVLKLFFGFYMGSVSVIAEGVHSGMDLLAAAIATIAVYRSAKPADEDHAYGHGKYEAISGTAEAMLIFVAAIIIVYEAVYKMVHPGELELLEWGMLVMLISVIVNIGVSRTLMKVAKETDSMALEADALHLSTDVWTSVGVLVGLVLIRITNIFVLDPIVAIAVAVLIMKAAYDLTKRTFDDLTDKRIPEEEEKIVRDILKEHDHVIHDFHKLRTRMSGPDRHIDLHIVVSKYLGLEEVHNLCDHIENEIKAAISNAHVLIHCEPCDGECEICDEEEVCEELKRARLRKLTGGEGGNISKKDFRRIEELADQVLGSFEEVVSYHDLKVDVEESGVLVTLHIIVMAGVTVERTHEINHILENKLKYLFPDMEVIAHMEPCDGNCKECEEDCEKAGKGSDK
jgi:cation diffusion facilitator family transporter